MIDYHTEDSIAVLTWHMTSSPMNVLNDESIPVLADAIDRALSDEAIRGIIITSSKPEFIAGADLKMILRNNNRPPAAMRAVSENLNHLFRRIETGNKPVVAAINGVVLGGGYELCLACHRRIALQNPKTQIGLVEVTVGLIPGGGGTQRLPRLIGIEKALPLMLEGKKAGVAEALSLGLVDDVADTPDAMMQQAKNWIKSNPNAIQPWDERTELGTIQPRRPAPPADLAAFCDSLRADVQARTYGHYPAPLRLIDAVEQGLQTDINHGLEIEAEFFAQVGTSKAARSIIKTMFLGLNEANKGGFRPAHQPKTNVQTLGIIGAGFMGCGIAQVAAQAGIEVLVADVDETAAQAAKTRIETQLRQGKRPVANPNEILSRIRPTANLNDFQTCQLIIEAVAEDRNIKASVIQQVEPLLSDTAVFASNTSTLPISQLATASTRPTQFIGIHFFSPVPRMTLVEIIVGKQTNDFALAVAMDFVRKLRKTPIVVNDSPGFYTSRCFGTYTSEAMEMLREGINPARIEQAGREAGMPTGPLAVMDEISIGLIYQIAQQALHDGLLTDSATRLAIPKQLVETGRIGKKAGAGFYDYPTDKPKHLWPGLKSLFPEAATQPTLASLQQRLLYRQAIEAIRCLEEGVVRSVTDADVGSVLGWGFPAYTGGTVSLAVYEGIPEFIENVNRLALQHGDRFALTQTQIHLIQTLFKATESSTDGGA